MKKFTRIGASGAVVAGVVLAGVGVSNAVSDNEKSAAEISVGQAVDPQQRAIAGAGKPSYVPSGAKLAREQRPNDGSGGARYAYSLAGDANQSTITDEAIAAGELVHPETEILVSFNPSMTEFPEFIREEDEFFDVREVTIGDAKGLLTTPKNGLGAHRVDWISADGYHVVLEDRMRTKWGVSGVEVDELMKIAESVATA